MQFSMVSTVMVAAFAGPVRARHQVVRDQQEYAPAARSLDATGPEPVTREEHRISWYAKPAASPLPGSSQ